MIEYMRYIVGIGWPQGMDWLWIFLFALLIFGGKRLPEIARSIGKSLNEFKRGIKEVEDTTNDVVDDVKKIGDDVTKDAKNAAGLNENDH